MKILDGVKYFSIGEVGALINRSPQMIRLWDVWSTEREEQGLERFIPKPVILDNTKTRYWDEFEIGVLMQFADYKKQGILKDYSKRQYGAKYRAQQMAKQAKLKGEGLENAIKELEERYADEYAELNNLLGEA